MNISKVDGNFAAKKSVGKDIEWIEIPSEKVSLFGVFHDGKIFRRMPETALENLSDNIKYLATHTTGGRAFFETDSPFVALRGVENNVGLMSNMALFGVYGFSLSVNGVFRGVIMPESLKGSDSAALCPDRIDSPSERDGIVFEGSKDTGIRSGEKGVCGISFPLYTGVRNLFLGVRKGCVLQSANPYKEIPPIVFYGSSITHGACASRAGLEFASLLSEMLGVDFVNLGFAGNCRGEKEIAEYISGIDSSLYIIEYDHNAESADFLMRTHFEFYKTLREKAKKTPILFLSRPGPEFFSDADARRNVIAQTCESACKNGDTNVFFLGGEKLFGGLNPSLCTADTCHPNDVGFYKIAETVYSFIKEKKFYRRSVKSNRV